MRAILSMLPPLAILGLSGGSAYAFTARPLSITPSGRKAMLSLRETASADADVTVDVKAAKDEARKQLLRTVEQLKADYGVLIVEKQAKKDLKAVVEELEQLTEAPTVADDEKFVDQFLGDWTLICTTATTREGFDSSKLPSFLTSGPVKDLRDRIRKTANKNLQVEQRVVSTNNDGVIDRIDNVIQYKPPNKLSDISLFQDGRLPEQLSSLNVNPLDISKSKVVLIHKASLTDEDASSSFGPVKTKLSLQSIVLNVAGTSTMFEPSGKDIAGINIPSIGEFTNSGTFETTYIDDDIRISRGKQGMVDQLRVFVRSDKYEADMALEEIRSESSPTVTDGTGVEAQIDVDEVEDPYFADDTIPSDDEKSSSKSDDE